MLGEICTPEEAFARAHALNLEGKAEAALTAFLHADTIGDTRAARAAAVIAVGLGRLAQALSILQGLMRRYPQDADLPAMMAGLHIDLGEFSQALQCSDYALRLQRNHCDALINRGMALRGLGEVAATLANDRQLARAYLGNLHAQLNYADACLAAGDYATALLAADRALRLAPQTVLGRLLRGVALALLDRFVEAETEFSQAQAAEPQTCVAFCQRAARLSAAPLDALPLDARSMYISRWLDHLYRCDWSPRQSLLLVLRRELASLPTPILAMPGIAFHSLALPLTSAEQRAVACAVAASVKARAPRHELPLINSRTEGRLRIAYLSADFRQHPVAECLWRVFSLHEKKRFEIFAYALTPGDDSPLRARIAADAENFTDLSALSDADAAERIAADRLHILVDCSGYTEGARPQLLAARLAPVQAQILGAPGPCGGDFVDYRITDAFATPIEVAQDWDEALVYLPETLFLCDDTLNVPVSPTRTECGLPENAFVFCCFNNHYKIEPDVFDIWMRLLSQLPGSVLWLVEAKAEIVERLRVEAKRRGVDPQRLIFAPRVPLDQHLARHACADLFLDTLYYNAGTTAVYALRAGLPVLTCAGQTTVARMGGSVVRAAGLPELVVSSPKEYEIMAFRLATLPKLLAELRLRLQTQGPDSALFNTPRQVRALEWAYEAMWRRAESGEAPSGLVVPNSV